MPVGAYCAGRRPPPFIATAPRRSHMKGMNQKKQEKKKPAKTMKEKKAEKRDKKATKGFAPT
ncbi:hypothetical protein GCM10027430_17200 [Lysobacter tyrosinilyticus]